MERAEQSMQAAYNYINQRISEGQGRTGDVFPAFVEGVEWADENPNPELKKQWIKKACEWLQKHDSYSKPTELQVMDFRKYIKDEL